jgi:hypothetical protein
MRTAGHVIIRRWNAARCAKVPKKRPSPCPNGRADQHWMTGSFVVWRHDLGGLRFECAKPSGFANTSDQQDTARRFGGNLERVATQ